MGRRVVVELGEEQLAGRVRVGRRQHDGVGDAVKGSQEFFHLASRRRCVERGGMEGCQNERFARLQAQPAVDVGRGLRIVPQRRERGLTGGGDAPVLLAHAKQAVSVFGQRREMEVRQRGERVAGLVVGRALRDVAA